MMISVILGTGFEVVKGSRRQNYKWPGEAVKILD